MINKKCAAFDTMSEASQNVKATNAMPPMSTGVLANAATDNAVASSSNPPSDNASVADSETSSAAALEDSIQSLMQQHSKTLSNPDVFWKRLRRLKKKREAWTADVDAITKASQLPNKFKEMLQNTPICVIVKIPQLRRFVINPQKEPLHRNDIKLLSKEIDTMMRTLISRTEGMQNLCASLKIAFDTKNVIKSNCMAVMKEWVLGAFWVKYFLQTV